MTTTASTDYRARPDLGAISTMPLTCPLAMACSNCLHSTSASRLRMWPQALAYGGRGVSGEIDLIEYYSGVAPDVGFATLKHQPLLVSQPPTVGCTVKDPSAFHTYLLEWTPRLVTI